MDDLSRYSRPIEYFVRHKNAANLLLLLMVFSGLYGISQLGRQSMPDSDINAITVQIPWSGASPEDVESDILVEVERELRFIDKLRRIDSYAFEGGALVSIEFSFDASMSKALSDVQAAMSRVVTLPKDSESPVISQPLFRDTVVSLEISGPYSEARLKAYARDFRDRLQRANIRQVEIVGARYRELLVGVSYSALRQLGLSIQAIAKTIGLHSINRPSGSETASGSSKLIRSSELARSVDSLAAIEIRSLESGEKLFLSDIAQITEQHSKAQSFRRLGGAPSILVQVFRGRGEDSIEVRQKVQQALLDYQRDSPAQLRISVYNDAAAVVTDRLEMLALNGIYGLLIVLILLYFFLPARFSLWVALGIPVSLMATLGIMQALGMSLNIVSIFALIMGLGIIVDDAIVVSEKTANLHRNGHSAGEAAIKAANLMFVPVLAASLTTIAAFLPMLLIGGSFGQIQADLPKTMIAVVIASLIECFLILPAHLCAALKAHPKAEEIAWRIRLNGALDGFCAGRFTAFVGFCIRNRYCVLLAATGMLVISVALLVFGRIGFDFFPRLESNLVYADITLYPGASRAKTIAMLAELERAAYAVEKSISSEPQGLIALSVASIGEPANQKSSEPSIVGEHIGGLTVELVGSKTRRTRTRDFIAAWNSETKLLPGVQKLSIAQHESGPAGRDLDIRISGGSLQALKAAALALQQRLAELPGVSLLEDNWPYGKRQLLLKVSPEGKSMGFTTDSVTAAIRAAYEGAIASPFSEGEEEVVVRVRLAPAESDRLPVRDLMLRSPTGTDVHLSDIASLTPQQGFSRLARTNGVRQITVFGSVDSGITSSGAILEKFWRDIAPPIESRFGVEFNLMGEASEEAEAFSGVTAGTLVLMVLIYVVLAWVLRSYTQPLTIIAIIPFALIGIVLGHWVMGINLCMFSIIGMLGLSGIVVNDAIILVSTIQQKLLANSSIQSAILAGTRERLPAVLLTSLTTVGGLLPILLERSPEAELIRPVAVTIVFGLTASTMLILGLIPVLLTISLDVRSKTFVYRATKRSVLEKRNAFSA